MATRPNAIEFTVFWGFLHLTIELSLHSQRRWVQMAGIFKKARRPLERCKVSAEVFEASDELKSTLLNLFATLIQFWAEASKYMREMMSVTLGSLPMADAATAKFLDEKFDSALADMEAAVQNLERCAATRAAGLSGFRNAQFDRNMADTVAAKHSVNAEVEYTYDQMHQLPYNNDHTFVGREDVLAKIDAVLHPRDSPEQRVFSIWGIGGIGKSQVALAYANRHARKFAATFWVRAETLGSLHQSFKDIARKLRLLETGSSLDHDEIRDLILTWLLLCNKKWLIIFDNVEHLDLIKTVWPSSTGSLLLTTRSSVVADAARGHVSTKLQIQKLNSTHSWLLFSRLLMDWRSEWRDESTILLKEREAAVALLRELDGLPLGIRQIAALIKRRGKTVAKFLDLYRRKAGNTEMLLGTSKTFHFDQDYGLALDTVWKMSFEILVTGHDQHAATLLGLMSLLSPDVILTQLFLDESDGHLAMNFCHDEDV
ncbi:MAG: hypothetical protein M1832_002340 [Thelocarpon impressellum]|nr:MAG: hypothetical protein M1832_002340 [Thelocarpon impressellum]